MDNAMLLIITAFLMAGSLFLMAIHPHHPEKHGTIVSILFGVGSFGCGLDLIQIQLQYILLYSSMYLIMAFFGRWLMRAATEDYLKANAFSYVDKVHKIR